MTAERLKVGRLTVELSNTGKVLFPGDDVTKGDLVAHYQCVASLMLPFLRDRPISMTRYPDGIAAGGIVQKNVPRYFPDWITRARVRKEGGSLQQVICDKRPPGVPGQPGLHRGTRLPEQAGPDR